MDKHRLAPFFGVAVAILWGFSFLSIKVAVAVVPPMTMAFVRHLIAAAIMPLVALAAKEKLAVAWRDLPLLALGGLSGVTLYFLGENNGVALLSASESSLIIGAIPVLTVLSERIFLGGRLGGRAWTGAFLSFAGVGLIVARSGGATSSPLGYVYMGVAAVCWVVYSFVTRPSAARYGRVTVTFWQMLFGMIGCIPFALAEAGKWQVPGIGVSLNVLYLSVFCSALGYWLYVSALDSLGAGRTSVFINLIPVVSVVASFFILGERLGALQLVGGAVAVFGVYLATIPGKARAAPAA